MEASEYIRTGFTDLDNKIGGLRKSSLILLGARPAMGKITLVRDIAHNIMTENNNLNSVLFFTDNKFDEKNLFGENGKTILVDNSSNLAETIKNEALANKAKLLITSFDKQPSVFLATIREIASKLNIPVIVLVNLSREYSKGKGPRPTLEDFEVNNEQLELIDLIIYLHRESYYNSNGNERHIAPEIGILKNSFGKNTVVNITFDTDKMAFGNLQS